MAYWRRVLPDARLELVADAGRYLGYVGVTSRRIEGKKLAEYAWPSTLRSRPIDHTPHPVLRG